MKDPDFDPSESKEGRQVHRRIREELERGGGPAGIKRVGGAATPKYEKRYELRVGDDLSLTAQPDIVYEDQGRVEIVEIKKRAGPSLLDFFQAVIAIIAVRGERSDAQVTAHVYYDKSGQMLSVDGQAIGPDQRADIMQMAQSGGAIKQGEEARKARRGRWGRRGGAEEEATEAYSGFEEAVRRTGNRGGLTISNQFPDQADEEFVPYDTGE